MGVGGFAAMRALSTRNGDPEHASRPFDLDRDGFVIGPKGRAFWFWKSWAMPAPRGEDLRRSAGYGMSSDAFNIISLRKRKTAQFE